MSCLGMDNKKTPADDLQARKARAWEAIEKGGRRVAEEREAEELAKKLASLHGVALGLNFNKFLERGDEFIGPIYRAADYSVWKRDTYTLYQWAALTLGLEPNQDDPPLGPIPFQWRVARDFGFRYPHFERDKPYFHRLDSFHQIVELMKSSQMAGKLQAIEQGLRPINYLKEDLIAWNRSNELPVPDVISKGSGAENTSADVGFDKQVTKVGRPPAAWKAPVRDEFNCYFKKHGMASSYKELMRLTKALTDGGHPVIQEVVIDDDIEKEFIYYMQGSRELTVTGKTVKGFLTELRSEADA